MLPGYSSTAGYHEDIDSLVGQFVNMDGKTWTLAEVVYNRILHILVE